MILHATIQFINYGFVWSGLLTAIILLIEGYLGYSMTKKFNKKIYNIHRTIALLLVIALCVHLIHIKFFFSV
ncbi:hypothetical protein [Streptobacillus canis]|uniref:hypothetical protein n=1 Tax=Streptobacillus canis TaxID=2678686 RepID=UPI0012E25EFA|nr:hypothetical protein [Streptobacillus canis]